MQALPFIVAGATGYLFGALQGLLTGLIVFGVFYSIVERYQWR